MCFANILNAQVINYYAPCNSANINLPAIDSNPIGAINAASAAGNIVGGAITGLVGNYGFWAGAITGLGSGFASGFISTFGNQTITENSQGNESSFNNRLKTAFKSGVIGGVIKGITNGMALKDKSDFSSKRASLRVFKFAITEEGSISEHDALDHFGRFIKSQASTKLRVRNIFFEDIVDGDPTALCATYSLDENLKRIPSSKIFDKVATTYIVLNRKLLSNSVVLMEVFNHELTHAYHMTSGLYGAWNKMGGVGFCI
jgi:hypothetical protein